jgi:hypothetical protein
VFGSIGDKIGDDLVTAIRASVDTVLGKRIVIETSVKTSPTAAPIEVHNVITFEDKTNG